MESVAVWQGLALSGIFLWIVITSYFNVTKKIRSLLQPWVAQHVVTSTSIILKIQKHQHKFWDALFSGLSCVVSVPFYTAFLPLLFWSGHGKLARQMTLLMAFCDYLGNCIKDVVSAPRPSCPPVRRITATKDEEENAMEYGLPSSHTLNTVCLSGYLVCYVLSYTQTEDAYVKLVAVALAFLIVGLIGFGRIYLGMHSLIDIIVGLALGLVILAMWLTVHEYVDGFIVSGQNDEYESKPSVDFGLVGITTPFDVISVVTGDMLCRSKVASFWAALSFLLLFAYPTPEIPTPSFEYHTAFNGVALGIVAGIQQAYHQFHHEAVPRIFTPQLTIPAFLGRMLVGIPTILIVKFCSKALAKRILPVASNTLGIPIKSTSYIPMLSGSTTEKKSSETKQSSCIQKLLFFCRQDLFDVDTGIRFLQYAGLAWAVVDLVPSLFSYLRL